MLHVRPGLDDAGPMRRPERAPANTVGLAFGGAARRDAQRRSDPG